MKNFKNKLIFFTLSACFTLSSALANTAEKKLEIGVNLESLGFAHDHVPGKLNQQYFPIPRSDFDTYLSRGIKLFRIPFVWERIQPELYGDLDMQYLGYLNDAVNYALSHNATVILDVHNYAKRHINGKRYTIGDKELPPEALTDLWIKLGRLYANNDKIAFCIMNEPLVRSADKWANAMQDLTLALRERNINNQLQISGINFTGAWNWHSAGNAKAYENFHDPVNNFLFEVHQYNDKEKDGAATGLVKTVNAPDVFEGIRNLVLFTDWARQHHVKAHLGEMATSSDDEISLKAYENALIYMQKNPDVWVSHTAWGGSHYWGKNYPFRMQIGKGKLSTYGDLVTKMNRQLLPEE